VAAVRVSVFDVIRWSPGAASLAPVTPYLHNGAIVPCIAVNACNTDLRPFEFFHRNQADESSLCLGSKGTPLEFGDLRKLTETHAVNLRFMTNDPTNYAVVIVTIRMADDGPQEEEMILRCTDCGAVVHTKTFDVKDGPAAPHFAEFHALRYYVEWANEINRSEEARTCPDCSLVQEPFPIAQFGWGRFVANGEVANMVRTEALAAGSR
jgi:hypothetical protein